MTPDSPIRLAPGAVLRRESFGGLLLIPRLMKVAVINDLATDIASLCTVRTTPARVCRMIAHAYPQEESVKSDVMELMTGLAEQGFIVQLSE